MKIGSKFNLWKSGLKTDVPRPPNSKASRNTLEGHEQDKNKYPMGNREGSAFSSLLVWDDSMEANVLANLSQ